MAENLKVRPFHESDIPSVLDYWLTASSADLERMGGDATKLLPRAAWEENLRAIVRTPVDQTSVYYLVWEVDGRAIGFNSLKDIRRGVDGKMHLHMWEAASRGKGYGGTLFCRAALEFYRRFDLKIIYCEPRATNPLPNRMLQKIGFPLDRTYSAASSELALYCELNSYRIERAVAEAYLAGGR